MRNVLLPSLLSAIVKSGSADLEATAFQKRRRHVAIKMS